MTDFRKRFGEKLLWDSGVNLTILNKEDLRCGGLVNQSNISSSLNNSKPSSLSSLSMDCMIQKCNFRSAFILINTMCVFFFIKFDLIQTGWS